jgi:hypothetical protein
MNVHSRAHILTRTGELYAWFSEPDTTHGVRFEFINEPARAALLSKLAPNSGSSSSAGENFFQI